MERREVSRNATTHAVAASIMAGAALSIVEHRGTTFDQGAITPDQGELIHRKLGRRIDVEFPTPRSAYRWTLTSQGWVGLFRVDDDLTVVAEPKVAISNLARMLQRAHGLPIETLDGLVKCATMEELYDQLANRLAVEALILVHHGLHHVYRPCEERRAAVRGRLLLHRMASSSADPRVLCAFSERTADTVENQIVGDALYSALRGGYCTTSTRARVRTALRHFIGRVTQGAVAAEDLDRLRYDRLTSRYQRAHAIARLFLEARSPAVREGDRASVPFLLHMPSLFERFVEQWLADRFRQEKLPIRVHRQAPIIVGTPDAVRFSVDLLLTDDLGKPICVLDTKYKDTAVPAAGDVAQVAFYAQSMSAKCAGLVYPSVIRNHWHGESGAVSLFALSFDLSADLETAGKEFLDQLLDRVDQ